MATQTVSFDVDVPPGKEISHVSFEVPLRNPECINFYVTLVDAWEWPEWLAGWIAMDADGVWNWFSDEPVIVDEGWSPLYGTPCRQLWPKLAMPSSVRDWRMSKRGRPS